MDTSRLFLSPKPERPDSSGSRVNFKKLVIIGASTGGPQALEEILSLLPPGFTQPIIVVQHLPDLFFTESLAQHLNRKSSLPVEIAEDKEVIREGRVYLATGGTVLTVRRQLQEEGGLAFISVEEDDSRGLGPSIDMAMESASLVFKKNLQGVILTGIGHDGRNGMKKIKAEGGRTMVQDESSLILKMVTKFEATMVTTLLFL